MLKRYFNENDNAMFYLQINIFMTICILAGLISGIYANFNPINGTLAQEVICNKFQPSGVDYIIHVLSDQQRENYLQKFRSKDFQYVATQNPKFTDWEFGIERANWFFYSELYDNWYSEFANNYEVFWCKNDFGEKYVYESAITTQIVNINDSTKKIIVACSNKINGIADVLLDYEVHQKSQFLLNFRQLLFLRNTGYTCAKNPDYHEHSWLRSISKKFLPVVIHNGYGEITVTSPTQFISTFQKKLYLNGV